MQVIRDDKRINRLKMTGQIASLVGLAVLITSFVLAIRDPERYAVLQFVGLLLGWLISQVGIYMSTRFAREPRMDQVLDTALRGLDKRARLYHYCLPSPHVLLTRSGPVVIVPQFQSGSFRVDEKGRWRQSGINRLRRWFGQEGIGNPTRDALGRISALTAFLRKNVPEIEEVPIAAVIVFTSDNVKEIDAENSKIPAVHAKKVKTFLRKHLDKPLPAEQFALLREAFDAKAGPVADNPEVIGR